MEIFELFKTLEQAIGRTPVSDRLTVDLTVTEAKALAEHCGMWQKTAIQAGQAGSCLGFRFRVI